MSCKHVQHYRPDAEGQHRLPSAPCLPCSFPQQEQIKAFNFFARPRRFTQELEARSDTGVAVEAPNADALPQGLPSEVLDQFGEHSFQRNAM